MGSYKCSVLKYSDDGYFEFNSSGQHFKPKFSPGAKQKTTNITDDYIGWDTVIGIFRKWLCILKIEFGKPDLWEEISKYKPTFGIVSNDKIEDKFSANEVETIVITLEEIKINIDK